jgi:hypothetical protein
MVRHSLAFRRDGEEGVSGPSFADGLVLDSSDEPEEEGANRGFSRAKTQDWLQGGPGYRDWRSILSVPVLDTEAWIPVALIAITSNVAKPCWSELSRADIADLIAQLRRTAKLLIAEHRLDELRNELDKLTDRLPSPNDLIAAGVADAIMATPRLGNYSGYLCAATRSDNGLAIEVQMRQQPGDVSGEVSITDGVAESTVQFQLELVGEGLRFFPYAQPLSVEPGRDSGTLLFEYTKQPGDFAEQAAYVQLFQKNRLIHVLKVPLT